MITTNADHAFQKSAFDKATYDNKTQVRQMILAQGFEIAEDSKLLLPSDAASTQIKMQVSATTRLASSNICSGK